jgi:hypothetical protein
MVAKKVTALLLLCAAGVVGAIVIGYRSLLFGGMGGPAACLSEEWEEIPSLSGLSLEVEYTNCDTLAKDEAVSVYVVEAQEGSRPNLSKRRTLLFRYDPGGVGNPRPTIAASSDHRIVISVQEVSSVTFQRRKWRNVSIDYRIGSNKNREEQSR